MVDKSCYAEEIRMCWECDPLKPCDSKCCRVTCLIRAGIIAAPLIPDQGLEPEREDKSFDIEGPLYDGGEL